MVEKNASHREFAAHCFNAAWELLDRADRTPEDDERMVHLSHASFWHWTRVEGHTPANLSVGYWQLARVYATVGDAAQAERYARRCLEASEGLTPFYRAYAHEALARAAWLKGEAETCRRQRARGLELSDEVADDEERRLVTSDLEQIDPARRPQRSQNSPGNGSSDT